VSDQRQQEPSRRDPLDVRYPDLAGIDVLDDEHRLDALDRTLDTLRRELNDQRQS